MQAPPLNGAWLFPRGSGGGGLAGVDEVSAGRAEGLGVLAELRERLEPCWATLRRRQAGRWRSAPIRAG